MKDQLNDIAVIRNGHGYFFIKSCLLELVFNQTNVFSNPQAKTNEMPFVHVTQCA
jgi:hypothetical protein